jgi:hypothetical protein
MATLRDCFFAYQHESAGADLNAEVKIVRVKRVDLDFELQVCEACAAGLLEYGQFALVEEVAEPQVEEPVVSLQELLEGGTGENAEEGEGE